MAWIRASQGGSDPTNITPSNASPPSMVTNGVYKSTGSGYAISSYSNITPRNDETVALTSGNIYKATGNGVAVASVTPITPSSDSPVYLAPNNNYKPDVSGYAVGSVNPLTPSNTTPEYFSPSFVYKPDAVGYAISSYQSITPSAGGTAFNAGMVKMSAGGYACTSQPGTPGFVLLGSQVSKNTSATTVSLSDGINKYKYLFVSLCSIQSNKVNVTALGGPPIQLIATSSWVSGSTMRGYYALGSSGSMSSCYVDITYVSNTSIQFKKSNANERTVYFYGLK